MLTTVAGKLASLTATCLVAAVAHAAVDASPTPRGPNILFAIADDWSFGHAGVYGCTWIKTPGFDRVARGGILFTHAYTPTGKCAPSRSAILTGRNPWQLEDAANHMCHFPAKFGTFMEGLARGGYFTGHTGKGWGPGIAVTVDGKPREMTGKAFNGRRAPASTDGISMNDYAGNFEDFLAAAPPGQPWFFWYGGLEPHRNYEFGSGAKAGKMPSDIDRVPGYWPDHSIVRNDMLDYALEVEHFDAHLLRMIQMLEARGQLENTLVIVTSDNGMPFPRVKGYAYDSSNRMPLAVMWPRGIRGEGRVVADYVSFIDFAPTFLELAKLNPKDASMVPITGRSLVEIFQADGSGRVIAMRDHVLVGKERTDIGRPDDAGYPIRGIIQDDILYLRNFEPTRWPAGDPETGYLDTDGSPTKTLILQSRRQSGNDPSWGLCFGKRPGEELYDLSRDPDCIENLSASPGHQLLKQRLRDRMINQLKSENDPRILGRGDIFDEYPYSSGPTRNFYERFTAGEKIRAGWVNEDDYEPAPIR